MIIIYDLEKKRITLKDNTQLEIMVIKAQPPVKGTMQILHGMAEHMDRYMGIAQYFSELGYQIILHNHRGHGKLIDESSRGHFDSIEQLVDDAHEIFETFYTSGRKIILGHSMGSIVTRCYLARYPDVFDDCILVGTGYYDKKYQSSKVLLKALMKVHPNDARLPKVNAMSNQSFNQKFKPLRTKSDWLSLNEDNVDTFIQDPYCGFDMSLQALFSIAQTMGETQKASVIQKMNPDLNLLFVSGKDDPFSHFGKGIKILARKYHKCGIENVTVQLYKDARHEVLNEVNRLEVLENIRKWLLRYE